MEGKFNNVICEKLEDSQGYKYCVPYLHEVKEVFVDEELPPKCLSITNDQGKYYAKIRIDADKFQALSVYLYGHRIMAINGNTLDYRKINCKKFSMGDYNINHRRYVNSLGYAGVKKCSPTSNKFTFTYCRDGKTYKSKENFSSALAASIAREETLRSKKGDVCGL